MAHMASPLESEKKFEIISTLISVLNNKGIHNTHSPWLDLDDYIAIPFLELDWHRPFAAYATVDDDLLMRPTNSGDQWCEGEE